MEKNLYTMEYLEGLTQNELLELMEEHGYEEGFEELDNKALIEQLSNIVEY